MIYSKKLYMGKKKIALVTGGAKRLGKEICLFLAKNEYLPVIHYNNSEEEARNTADEIKFLTKQNPTIIKKDLNNLEESKQIIPEIIRNYGKIDLLLNNASSFLNDDICDKFDLDKLKYCFNVNFLSPTLLINQFVELNKNNYSNIINILDYCIIDPPKDFMSHYLSKSALANLTMQIARSIAPYIRINSIAPGPIDLSMYQDEDKFRKMYKNSPLQIPTSYDDVCNTIKYLLDTASITGQTICVDSGRSLGKIEYY